jgi:hypothetical protein
VGAGVVVAAGLAGVVAGVVVVGAVVLGKVVVELVAAAPVGEKKTSADNVRPRELAGTTVLAGTDTAVQLAVLPAVVCMGHNEKPVTNMARGMFSRSCR